MEAALSSLSADEGRQPGEVGSRHDGADVGGGERGMLRVSDEHVEPARAEHLAGRELRARDEAAEQELAAAQASADPSRRINASVRAWVELGCGRACIAELLDDHVPVSLAQHPLGIWNIVARDDDEARRGRADPLVGRERDGRSSRCSRRRRTRRGRESPSACSPCRSASSITRSRIRSFTTRNRDSFSPTRCSLQPIRSRV